MSAPAPVITVQDVCFAYGPQEVLHNVSFEIPEHTLVVIVGPNGGGKTTLLKLLLGAEEPGFGTVRVFGQQPAAVRRRIGYVPQQLLFDPRFPVSVLDVVLIGRVDRHRFGPYRAVDRRLAQAALQQVGLESFGGRSFSDLSGGERQRVLVAQALVAAPELLLLDEPTASIDAAGAAQLYSLFRELSAQRTVLMVSHNLNVITSHATHLLCVNRSAELRPVMAGDHHLRQVSEAPGLLIIDHDPACHVIDAAAVMRAPHTGAPDPEDIRA